MRYAFRITSTIFVDALDEDVAWEVLPTIVNNCISDLEYERVEEEDQDDKYRYILMALNIPHMETPEILTQIYTTYVEAKTALEELPARKRNVYRIQRLDM